MTASERNLDPEDWAEFEEVSHRVLSELVEFVKRVDENPVWRKPPRHPAQESSKASLPTEGVDIEQLWQELKEDVLPYLSGNLHPRFFGWAHGAGTPAGALGELIAGFINANLAGRNQVPVRLENQVIGWFSELLDFPEKTSGTLVSGTSLGNFVALTVARDAKSNLFRTECTASCPRLYVSEACHLSVTRAAHLAGFPSNSVRPVETDSSGRLVSNALAEMIEEDKSAGHDPVAVVATVGTSGTGAIDPLCPIVSICHHYNLWLHVDGAFGALSYLSPNPPQSVRNLSGADSVAFDFHKWLQVPYAVGCVLIRDRTAHLDTFAASAPYVRMADGELGGGQPWPTNFGPEMSRGFRGLKVWVTLRHFGLERLVAQIDQSRSQAEEFGDWVRDHSHLELCVPVSLNIVCLRYKPHNAPCSHKDLLQERIVEDIQARGVAAPSATQVDHRTCIRLAIFNHRTKMDDLLAVGEEIVETGNRLV